MTWTSLQKDEKILIAAVLVVTIAFGMTFSLEIMRTAEPSITGKIIGNEYCGDGICNGGEDEFTCSLDCGFTGYCGDNICEAFEEGICEADCPTTGTGEYIPGDDCTVNPGLPQCDPCVMDPSSCYAGGGEGSGDTLPV